MNEDLKQAVRSFPAERLDQPLVLEAPYTAYTQFIGVTQHNLHHAGQMTLLKKALGSDGVLKERPGQWGGLTNGLLPSLQGALADRGYEAIQADEIPTGNF